MLLSRYLSLDLKYPMILSYISFGNLLDETLYFIFIYFLRIFLSHVHIIRINLENFACDLSYRLILFFQCLPTQNHLANILSLITTAQLPLVYCLWNLSLSLMFTLTVWYFLLFFNPYSLIRINSYTQVQFLIVFFIFWWIIAWLVFLDWAFPLWRV